MVFLVTLDFENLSNVMFMPFGAFAAALPGLIVFGYPTALLFNAVGLQDRIYWIGLGITTSIATTYLIFDQNPEEILLTAIPIGTVTGYLVQKRLYTGKTDSTVQNT
ncbi:MAG: hypothetical protein ACQEQL_08675 [Pseudomonadota bacterium]